MTERLPLLPRHYICVLCGADNVFTTNHEGVHYATCPRCTWKSNGVSMHRYIDAPVPTVGCTVTSAEVMPEFGLRYPANPSRGVWFCRAIATTARYGPWFNKKTDKKCTERTRPENRYQKRGPTLDVVFNRTCLHGYPPNASTMILLDAYHKHYEVSGTRPENDLGSIQVNTTWGNIPVEIRWRFSGGYVYAYVAW